MSGKVYRPSTEQRLGDALRRIRAIEADPAGAYGIQFNSENDLIPDRYLHITTTDVADDGTTIKIVSVSADGDVVLGFPVDATATGTGSVYFGTPYGGERAFSFSVFDDLATQREYLRIDDSGIVFGLDPPDPFGHAPGTGIFHIGDGLSLTADDAARTPATGDQAVIYLFDNGDDTYELRANVNGTIVVLAQG